MSRARSRIKAILVAEDDPAVRELLREILSNQGYLVLLAAHSAEALEIARQHRGPIHLLISDVIMPGISGPELAYQLRGLRPEMNVLYVSGYADDALSRRGALVEGTTFLQKPVSPEVLLEKVRQILGREG
ncbi:MAG TPA: response regulator [Terriglobales bacterium]|nr:response regulator [Terriglobales bacterium]